MEETTKKSVIGGILSQPGLGILSFLAWLAFFSERWYRRVYGDTGFDSIIFSMICSIEGVDFGLIRDYLLGGLLPAVGTFMGQGAALFLLGRSKWAYTRLTARAISLVLSLVLLGFSLVDIGFVRYVCIQAQHSELYETEYVDPKGVDIQFPEQKRNLIYIYLESMETTFLDQGQGGAMEMDLMPQLHSLARENVNFSHNAHVGGMVEIPGATWSMGAMVAQTAGVPLVIPSRISQWKKASGEDGTLLPGLTSMSDILAENGYYQSLMMGCDSYYGGERAYAETHQVDKIYDLYTGRQDGVVAQDYFAWWGFEDKYLFEYAKQELTEISQRGEPFAFTMLTMDTHHINGYTCALCEKDYPEPYENVIACASKQVGAFVEWIQAQPFYENTTIVITGDHFSMDAQYFTRNVPKGYTRHGYNCIINAPIQPENTQNRVFSSLDMYPTTLAALGCQIPGDRLGLGVNLFSSRKTLPEIYGYEAFYLELQKFTAYYDAFYQP